MFAWKVNTKHKNTYRTKSEHQQATMHTGAAVRHASDIL